MIFCLLLLLDVGLGAIFTYVDIFEDSFFFSFWPAVPMQRLFQVTEN